MSQIFSQTKEKQGLSFSKQNKKGEQTVDKKKNQSSMAILTKYLNQQPSSQSNQVKEADINPKQLSYRVPNSASNRASSDGSNKQTRWDRLYENSAHRQEYHNVLQKKYRLSLLETQKKECTFFPELSPKTNQLYSKEKHLKLGRNKSSPKVCHGRNKDSLPRGQEDNFFQRSTSWQKQMKLKLDKKYSDIHRDKQKSIQDLQKRPVSRSKSRKNSPKQKATQRKKNLENEMKAIDNYINRMQKANQKKYHINKQTGQRNYDKLPSGQNSRSRNSQNRSPIPESRGRGSANRACRSPANLSESPQRQSPKKPQQISPNKQSLVQPPFKAGKLSPRILKQYSQPSNLSRTSGR